MKNVALYNTDLDEDGVCLMSVFKLAIWRQE